MSEHNTILYKASFELDGKPVGFMAMISEERARKIADYVMAQFDCQCAEDDIDEGGIADVTT